MPNANPSPFSRLVTNLVSGLVSTASQTFAGAKTFLATIIASAGIQVGLLFNTNGTSASDVAVKIGTSTADGSVNAAAKLLSIRTGLNGGTEVEKVYWVKSGQQSFYGVSDPCIRIGTGNDSSSSVGFYSTATSDFNSFSSRTFVYSRNTQFCIEPSTGQLRVGGNQGLAGGAASSLVLDLSATIQPGGRFDQQGTDDSANAGNRTVNKPTGTNKLATGATTCVITNSLCSATSRVMVTFHDDPGSRYWVTRAAGSFTVNLSTAAGADKIFSWEVSSIL